MCHKRARVDTRVRCVHCMHSASCSAKVCGAQRHRRGGYCWLLVHFKSNDEKNNKK